MALLLLPYSEWETLLGRRRAIAIGASASRPLGRSVDRVLAALTEQGVFPWIRAIVLVMNRDVNPATGLPWFDDGLVGCKIISFEDTVLHLDRENGTGKQAVYAGTMQANQHSDDEETGDFFDTHNIDEADLVGKKILSTGLVLWRKNGLGPDMFVANLDPAPGWILNGPRAARPGDEVSVCWAVGPDAFVYPRHVEPVRGEDGEVLHEAPTGDAGCRFGSFSAWHARVLPSANATPAALALRRGCRVSCAAHALPGASLPPWRHESLLGRALRY